MSFAGVMRHSPIPRPRGRGPIEARCIHPLLLPYHQFHDRAVVAPLKRSITTSAGYTGGGIEDPFSIAIDKSGNVWTANVTPDSLSEISSTGTPATLSPYTGGGLNAPYSIA